MERGLARVVLADDDGEFRASCAAALRAGGLEVREASDGVEALTLVRSSRPDLLVMGLRMPGLDGLGAMESLRVDPSGALLTIVILACACESDARLECFAAGADAFLVKGLAPESLLREVREALARSRELIASP